MAVVPDLAVEVLSPGNTPAEVEWKANDYLAAGTKVVRIIHSATRTAVEQLMDDASVIAKSLLSADELMTARSIQPGLSVPVAAVLR